MGWISKFKITVALAIGFLVGGLNAENAAPSKELQNKISAIQSRVEQMPMATRVEQMPIAKSASKSDITYIYSKNVNSKHGVVITKPGVYSLAEDIVYKPRKSSSNKVSAAITIASSNVTLLLHHYTLKQHVPKNPSDQTPFAIGILVPDLAPTNTDTNYIALESIHIIGKEATISDFSMFGIRVFGHVADVQISNLTITNTGLLASLALRPFPNYFPHSSYVTSYGPPFGVAAISIGESAVYGYGPQFFTETNGTYQNKVQSVIIENVSCLFNFFNALFIANTTDVAINNSHFDGTFSDDPGNANGANGLYQFIPAIGANFSASGSIYEDPHLVNMVVNNSTFNNTTFGGDYTTIPVQDDTGGLFPVAGVSEDKSENVVYNNCQIDNSSNLFAPIPTLTGGYASGYLSGSNTDCTFLNCSFDGTTGLGSVNGFHRSGSGSPYYQSSFNTHLINCTANNTHNIGDLQLPAPTILSDGYSAGFAVYYAKNFTLDNCIAQDVVVDGALDDSSSASGFLLFALTFQTTPDATVENIVLRNCVASRIYANNGGNANGFTVDVPTYQTFLPNSFKCAVFENCIAANAGTFTPTLTTPGIVQGVGCGFFVNQATQLSPDEFRSWPASFTGCKAMHNKGLPSAGGYYSAGYFLTGAQRHSLYDCEAEDNVYGFLLQNCDHCTIRNGRADNNVDLNFVPGTGGGYVDTGTTGTAAVPTASTSLFEANRAFANGSGTVHLGDNGNYNILYAGGVFPLLTGTISPPAFPTSVDYVPSHNISIIE